MEYVCLSRVCVLQLITCYEDLYRAGVREGGYRAGLREGDYRAGVREGNYRAYLREEWGWLQSRSYRV